mgnify:CR=1 FL=1
MRWNWAVTISSPSPRQQGAGGPHSGQRAPGADGCRRAQSPGYACPAFRLDADNRSVHCRGEDIHLADMEYRILSLFVRNPNTFFTANELYQKIWGKDSLGDVRTVQVHIHNLRSKIEPDPAKPVYLCNVWGKGYVFRPEGKQE